MILEDTIVLSIKHFLIRHLGLIIEDVFIIHFLASIRHFHVVTNETAGALRVLRARRHVFNMNILLIAWTSS